MIPTLASKKMWKSHYLSTGSHSDLLQKNQQKLPLDREVFSSWLNPKDAWGNASRGRMLNTMYELMGPRKQVNFFLSIDEEYLLNKSCVNISDIQMLWHLVYSGHWLFITDAEAPVLDRGRVTFSLLEKDLGKRVKASSAGNLGVQGCGYLPVAIRSISTNLIYSMNYLLNPHVGCRT